MTLQLNLPAEVLEALGPTPQRTVFESVLLNLLIQKKITVSRAAELLDMDVSGTLAWYATHLPTYPELDDDEFDELISAMKARTAEFTEEDVIQRIEEALATRSTIPPSRR